MPERPIPSPRRSAPASVAGAGSQARAADARLYIVAYDIRDPKRWRRVFKAMHGYGEWLQLSVFQCRLSRPRQDELIAAIDQLIHHKEDHVIVL
jgi:CRISPR-associated protein Cas2